MWPFYGLTPEAALQWSRQPTFEPYEPHIKKSNRRNVPKQFKWTITADHLLLLSTIALARASDGVAPETLTESKPMRDGLALK